MVDYKKGKLWNRALTGDMKEFERTTGKSAVYHNKITGQFEHWLWKKEHPCIKGKKPITLDTMVKEYTKSLAWHVGEGNVNYDYKIDKNLPEEFGTGYLYTFYTRSTYKDKWQKEFIIGFSWDEDKNKWVEY